MKLPKPQINDKGEKRYKLFTKEDCMEKPCYLEVIVYPDGAIAFVGDEYSEKFVYAYKEQAKLIKRLLNIKITNTKD